MVKKKKRNIFIVTQLIYRGKLTLKNTLNKWIREERPMLKIEVLPKHVAPNS